MPGRPLAITQRQITALAKGAAKAGCIAEVVRNAESPHPEMQFPAPEKKRK